MLFRRPIPRYAAPDHRATHSKLYHSLVALLAALNDDLQAGTSKATTAALDSIRKRIANGDLPRITQAVLIVGQQSLDRSIKEIITNEQTTTATPKTTNQAPMQATKATKAESVIWPSWIESYGR